MKTGHHPITTGRDVSLDYLRALATVLVLVIHCSAPYTRIAQRAAPASWQSPVPILDTAHSGVLDYVLTYLDVSTMSLMFFISGLFTYPGLRRKGSLAFVKDRAVRLGLPYLAMTLLWMPLAYYAPWSLAHPGGALGGFLVVNAQARFASGPGWFLWLLLFFDCVMATLYLLGGRWMRRLLPWIRRAGEMPALWALLLIVAGVVSYVPLALRYGGGWLRVITPPLMLQPSRAIYYGVWLFAGFLAGSAGLEEGLLSRAGPLARGWLQWVLFALVAGNSLWFGSAALSASGHRAVIGLLWVLADVGICFGLLALFRAQVCTRRAWADSLARHAYAIYALHYVFALWIERWLLRVPLTGLAKFSLALAGTFAISWLAAIGWLRVLSLYTDRSFYTDRSTMRRLTHEEPAGEPASLLGRAPEQLVEAPEQKIQRSA